MPPPTGNGAAYKLNPVNWDSAEHDRQRVEHMASPRAFAPGLLHSPGAYQEYHAHLSRTQDGFSEPSAIWSSPTGVSMAYPLTPHLQSHIHHTRMNERVSTHSVPCLWS
jgi:hypothetical protein